LNIKANEIAIGRGFLAAVRFADSHSMSSGPPLATLRSKQLDPAAGPFAHYQARRQAGELIPDPAQEAAVEKLQSLWQALVDYKPGNGDRGWRTRLGMARAPDPSPMGLYIFGGVGRGKSMLMDMFFNSAPVALKRRVHFYAFMLEVHDRIHARRAQKGDPIVPVA
jgi:cell division protein ZapE